ncbi:MAG: helix-turn-helix domain-containing protein [Sphingomicrobium sp.]
MVDDEPVVGAATVGEQLRAAREAKGLTVEDVASSTRIPTRHLQALEDSEWNKLPAATYSIGFAKSYATAVGLERAEIADQLRAEMGSELPAHFTTATTEPLEIAEGNRSMPKGVLLGALIALAVVISLFTWLSNRELQGGESATDAVVSAEADTAPAAVSPAPAIPGPVVITADEPAWIEVRDGQTILKQGELAAGQSFEVPATATAPVLMTGKPEALRISVGTGDAPSIGPAGVRVTNVSLLGPDLLRGPAQVSAGGTPTPTTSNAQ